MDKRLNVPNCVTIIRLLLIVALNILLATGNGQIKTFLLVLCFLVLNYIGDVLDGYLARLLNQETKFGAILDVSVDAILLLSSYFILADKGIINYYMFYLTSASLLQFILSSLWVKKFSNKKPVFTFDTLGHYSIVLIETMLIFNISASFITSSIYVKTINFADLIVIMIGIAAILNRFRFYFMTPAAVEV